MLKVTSEFFGTALLLAVVTGSGIMGQQLSGGNDAVALLGNSIATGCGLFVLISLLGPISGAHFNPAVTLHFWRLRVISGAEASCYLCAQFSGAIAGVWLTHLMFNQAVLQVSTHARSGAAQMLSELVSTLVLLMVIRLGLKHAQDKIPLLVALTVTAGYWFTASTFFANPAVTLARSLTDTFVGIAPADVAGFVVSQIAAVWIISKLVKE
jgi:glycerol uptake facilitator-like aquaporin